MSANNSLFSMIKSILSNVKNIFLYFFKKKQEQDKINNLINSVQNNYDKIDEEKPDTYNEESIEDLSNNLNNRF